MRILQFALTLMHIMLLSRRGGGVQPERHQLKDHFPDDTFLSCLSKQFPGG